MSTISAGTLLSNALVQTGDTSGNLVFQTNGNTTAMTIDTNQNVTYANGVSFTGVIGGNGANISSMNASNLTSGTVATARLASGTANSSTYLRGDQTWAVLSAPNNGTLTMNTSGTGLTGSATFTADQSGNSTFTVTSNANSANGASTIVARDSSGNFTSNNVTLTTGSFSGGSNTAPSITFTGDTNTGIFSPAADTIAFTEGGTEVMRIDSSGNVGIGTSSPTFAAGGGLNVANGTFATMRARGGSSTGTDFAQDNSSNGYVWNRDNATLQFGTNNTERMRITSGGEVIIGGSTSGGADLTVDGSGGRIACLDTNGGIYFGTTPSGGFSTNGAVARAALSNYHISGSGAGDLCIAPDGGRNILFGSATSSGIGCSLAARITSTGEFQFNSGYGSCTTAYGCRAWVNFNGQTNAIRASGNVSSISDRGTGLYTVNFTNAMPDTNYSVSGLISSDVTTQAIIFIGSTNADVLTTSVRIDACNPNVGNIERQVMCVQIFR